MIIIELQNELRQLNASHYGMDGTPTWHYNIYNCTSRSIVWKNWWFGAQIGGNSKYKNLLKNILTVKSQHGITTSTSRYSFFGRADSTCQNIRLGNIWTVKVLLGNIGWGILFVYLDGTATWHYNIYNRTSRCFFLERADWRWRNIFLWNVLTFTNLLGNIFLFRNVKIHLGIFQWTKYSFGECLNCQEISIWGGGEKKLRISKGEREKFLGSGR